MILLTVYFDDMIFQNFGDVEAECLETPEQKNFMTDL